MYGFRLYFRFGTWLFILDTFLIFRPLRRIGLPFCKRGSIFFGGCFSGRGSMCGPYFRLNLILRPGVASTPVFQKVGKVPWSAGYRFLLGVSTRPILGQIAYFAIWAVSAPRFPKGGNVFRSGDFVFWSGGRCGPYFRIKVVFLLSGRIGPRFPKMGERSLVGRRVSGRWVEAAPIFG